MRAPLESEVAIRRALPHDAPFIRALSLHLHRGLDARERIERVADDARSLSRFSRRDVEVGVVA
jgi:hypothetical protein